LKKPAEGDTVTEMDAASSLSAQDLASLLDCARQFAVETDHDRLVKTILERACAMTDSPDGAILLYDAERGGLFFAEAMGEKASELLANWSERSNQRVPLQGSKAGEAFTAGKMIVEHRLQQDDRHFKGVDEQTNEASRSMLCIPLRTENRIIGVVQTLNKRNGDYDERDKLLLEHFSVQAGAAIRAARLIRDLVAQKGLYSRAGLQDDLGLLNAPAVRERMTMLFADMRGFTQLCQSQANPTSTQEILNDLLTMFADQVLVRGGVVNKFMGDEVFAFFRHDHGPERAVRCAFGMLERFEVLRRKWDESSNVDLSFLDLGIGITTDEVTVGTIGSAQVRDFTAIGNAVNLASAFQREARGGRRVLVDQATWAAVRELIADSDGPTAYELHKPGQTVAVAYRQYNLKRLKPETPVRVFISHNHQDRLFVERNITGPLAKRGIETWYSNSDIIPGEKYVRAIETGLLKSDWVIVIVSQHAAESDWVRAEIRTALKDPRLQSRILPVAIDDTKPSVLGDDLGQLHALDAHSSPDLGEAIFRLLAAPAEQKKEGATG
jgi:adenylate cyclase